MQPPCSANRHATVMWCLLSCGLHAVPDVMAAAWQPAQNGGRHTMHAVLQSPCCACRYVAAMLWLSSCSRDASVWRHLLCTCLINSWESPSSGPKGARKFQNIQLCPAMTPLESLASTKWLVWLSKCSVKLYLDFPMFIIDNDKRTFDNNTTWNTILLSIVYNVIKKIRDFFFVIL